MCLKLLLLALAVVGVPADRVSNVVFGLDGRQYRETVTEGDKVKIVDIPQQGPLADNTIIMHDFKMGLTAFKDLTTRRCIVIPLNNVITGLKGVIFKDGWSTSETIPSRYIVLTADETPVEDIQAETGDKIVELCDGLPTFRARVFRGDSTVGRPQRRHRRTSESRSEVRVTMPNGEIREGEQVNKGQRHASSAVRIVIEAQGGAPKMEIQVRGSSDSDDDGRSW